MPVRSDQELTSETVEELLEIAAVGQRSVRLTDEREELLAQKIVGLHNQLARLRRRCAQLERELETRE